VQIRLHHHRKQCLVHPAAPLQQRREERAGPQPRDLQVQITGHGREHPRPVPIAVIRALRCPLVRHRTDHRRQLGLNQRLVDRLCRHADPLLDIRASKHL
jgi:hypothetical protein